MSLFSFMGALEMGFIFALVALGLVVRWRLNPYDADAD